MALTKVTKSGITDNAIDADKLEDGTIVAADITPGTITADKLNSTLDLSSKTVTLPNSSVSNAMLAGSIANAKLANSSLTVNGTSVSLGGSLNAGTLDWQSVITADGSTGTTGVAGRGYFINTTSAAHTFTLPASATRGDTIAIVDYAETFATNKLTIARNGHNIQGVANNSQIGTNRASVTLVYVDSTKGWVYQDESNVAGLGQALFTSATGGTVTTSGNFKIHVFTGDGCFAVSQVGNSPVAPTGGPATVEYLVVAGGGGAGSGSGAGAGGFRSYTALPGASPLNAGDGITITATTYPVTVGGGGTGTNSGCSPTGNGSNSVFSTITSAGGGKSTNGSGGPGGSGGGTSTPGNTAGSGNTPPVSPPQGNPSGNSAGNGKSGGGGAGAAGVSGTPGTTGPAGAGGAGSFVVNCFLGPTAPSYGTPGPSPTARYFAGGGGGSTYSAGTPGTLTAQPGGAGGGGAGGATVPSAAPVGNAGTAGTANTGGGGGGFSTSHSSGPTGGAGGKGIVLIRYQFQ